MALGPGVAACGGARTTPHGTANAAATDGGGGGGGSTNALGGSSTHNNDRDNDGDHNDDDEKVLYFGHAADATDQRISLALVTRYFALAATGDGAKACSLLVPFIAESVAENDGHSPALRGKTCAVVMSKLFKLHHRSLAEKNATLKAIEVRVESDRALVVLEFPTIPEVRQITERRVGSTWKLLDLLDGILE